MFTQDELLLTVGSLKARKAPEPDGIPAEALKVVARHHPRLLLDMYNAYLRAKVFPAPWKVAHLELTSKSKGPADAPSSYRPLCMLNTAGKTMEKMIKERILPVLRASGGLSDRQHGSRKGHSTVGAISDVIEAVARADMACHQARPLVLLVTLDVHNAFNLARWINIFDALGHFKVPGYLLKVVGDYPSDRWLVYPTQQEQRRRAVTARVAQGSVLGPDLWVIEYDGLLRVEMPSGVYLVAYVDDAAIVITARTMELAQFALDQAMRRVLEWMRSHGLQLVIPTTEIVMLTRRRIPTILPMTIGDEVLQTQSSAWYLGVRIDTKLTYGEHIRGVCDKAAKATVALSRLMANVGRPRPARRRLHMSTVQSMLLYGAEMWATAMDIRKYRSRMVSVQRQGALRVACCYRTVSAPAALVAAGIIPIDLLAKERREIYDASPEARRDNTAMAAREHTLAEW